MLVEAVRQLSVSKVRVKREYFLDRFHTLGAERPLWMELGACSLELGALEIVRLTSRYSL